ncbi:sacsin N-terminal ATP-binding-like domain-containing protein [Streptomyces sp. NPDC048603]|uniref:sacsin N-terminal ATP-binding-like domain-containing protein n=1 Tax=Streptomyces sp. NPDC048603 TaxID=3365577 RepID=UPI0037202B92
MPGGTRGTAITTTHDTAGGDFRDIVIALTRRRIEIYQSAGEEWRFAESLKSVSEDTAQEYEGRTVLELVQNGHDALGGDRPGRISVLAVSEETGGVLYVANEGAAFGEKNFRAITEVALSSKTAGEGIGNKGLGFRSVLQLTDWPEIYSKASPSSPVFDGYCFRFARPEDVHALVKDPALASRVIEDISPLALPVPADVTDPLLKELAAEGFSTVVRLPLRDTHSWELAVAQMSDMVDGEAPLLLFLDRVAALVVEVRDDSPDAFTHVLSRSERTSGLVATHDTDWVTEVDLAGAGRYLLARRSLEAAALRDAVSRSVRARQIDSAWENWNAEAWVAVALRLDTQIPHGRMYTFLPMAAAVRSPFPGHVHAPFFTKLARLDISESVALNDHLLTQVAALTVELSRRIRSEAPHLVAADLVVDLVSWDVPHRLNAALDGKLDTEPVVPLHGQVAWGSLRDSYAWPEGKRPWRVLTADALAEAGAPLLGTSVGPVRQTRLDKLCRTLLSTPFRAPAQLTAEWVERVATTLPREDEMTAGPLWGDFYGDIAVAFARDPEALRGRRILLDQSMRLRSTLNGVTDSPQKGEIVFFYPDTTGGNSATQVPSDLKALRRRIAFTHPAIAWDVLGRDFLQRHRLVRHYESDRVFDALQDLLSEHISDALSRDVLTFAFRQYPVLTEAQRKRLPRIPFRVPLATNVWGKAVQCSFPPTWGTEGALKFDSFLNEGGTRIPALASQRDSWISGPDDWPIPLQDRTSWVEFLKALGVCDGLRPTRVGERIKPCYGNDLGPSRLAVRFGLGDRVAAAWVADVQTRWTRFAHPWTPYEFTRAPVHLTGGSEAAALTDAARREFAELLIHGLRTWGQEMFSFSVHRPTYSFKDENVWPTPLASFLRDLDWLPVEHSSGPVFTAPRQAWFSTDGELPAFIPALPLSIRRLLADKVVAERLLHLGLRRWDDPQHAGAAVRQLGVVLGKGEVPEYLSVSFKRHYERAWSQVAQTGVWPWAPGEDVQLAVSRTNALGTLMSSAASVGVDTLYVRDQEDPLKEALIELAGHPVLVAPAEHGGVIVQMAERNKLRVERTSATHVQVRHSDGVPITPAGEAAALVQGREWLVTVVALAMELKSGAFVRRSERGVRAALERLRTIRVVQADDVEIAIAGTPTEPPSTTRALPLPDEDHPTVVVWRSTEGWDELQAATPAVAQLLGRPWLQDALELILVKLERYFNGHLPSQIDDSALAHALDTTEAKVTEIRRHLTDDVQEAIRLIRPVLACVAASSWDEEAEHLLARAANDSELRTIVERYAPDLPIPSDDLVALARTSTTPAELRDELRLDFRQFNTALAMLGPGYSPYTYPERHEQAFGDFVRAHTDALVERLRERYAVIVEEDGDFSPYVAARGLHSLSPDRDWLDLYMTPPLEVMRAKAQEWLRRHGAEDDLDRPGLLQPLGVLRELNAAAISALVGRLIPLVHAWCHQHGVEAPAGWRNAVLMESKNGIDKTGLSDLVELNEERLLDAVQHAVGWPDGMPKTTELARLGLTQAHLAHATKRTQGSGGPSSIPPRTITIGDDEVTVGRDHLSVIADLAARTIGETFLAQSGRVRLDSVVDVPRPRTGQGSRKPRIVVAKMTQTNEDQRSAIGLVGEVAARAWLQRRYGNVRWTSGYAAVLNGAGEASDALGYDFEVEWRDTSRFFEVKALSEPAADRVEFEFGPSELETARRHARGSRYRILLITSALAPLDRRVFELPNPFSAQGRDRFRIASRGLRYQCSPLGGG